MRVFPEVLADLKRDTLDSNFDADLERTNYFCQHTVLHIQSFTDQLPAAEVIEPQKTSLTLRQDLSILCEVLQKAEPMCPIVVVP